MRAFVERSLVAQVADEAALRAEALAKGPAAASASVVEVTDSTEEYVQVLRAGVVVGASANVVGLAQLAMPEHDRPVRVDTVPFAPGSFVVMSVAADNGDVIVVGRSIDDVAEARRAVGVALAVGGPAILAIVGAVTWWIVGRALRPVEAIRLEVEQISTSELSRRVPAPSGEDEIARLATTMNGMLERLEVGHERQRRFVSDASHELRSPVASIRQHAEVARTHPNVMSVTGFSDTVLHEVTRLQDLVDDLLLLAQIDEGVPALTVDVDVDDLLLAEAARLRAVTPLEIDTSHVIAGRVRGDRVQLERVVRNLVDNAARHARTRVELSVRERDPGTIVVACDDDGPGIPEAEREHVLRRFVRLDEGRARDEGGSGLGLAIVREVIERHGGTTTLSAGALGGLRVEVALPGSTS